MTLSIGYASQGISDTFEVPREIRSGVENTA